MASGGTIIENWLEITGMIEKWNYQSHIIKDILIIWLKILFGGIWNS